MEPGALVRCGAHRTLALYELALAHYSYMHLTIHSLGFLERPEGMFHILEYYEGSDYSRES